MMLKSAYSYGVKTAYARFKIAIPLTSAPQGADYGVAPSGPETSHGTDRLLHAKGERSNADVAPALPQDQFNPDWLWKNQDLEHMGPGMVEGFGQEVIG